MTDIYIGIVIFVFVYLCYLLLIILNKRNLNRYIEKSKEVMIVKRKYDLKLNKINPKLVANMFGLTNGFVIGLAYIIMTLIDNIILKFLLILIILIIINLIAYSLIGKFLKRKEVK